MSGDYLRGVVVGGVGGSGWLCICGVAYTWDVDGVGGFCDCCDVSIGKDLEVSETLAGR